MDAVRHFLHLLLARRSVAVALGFVAILLATGLSGCGDDDGEDADGKLGVVATTAQIAALAREVGGDRIELTTLINPGADPHDFELTADSRKAIGSSDVVLRHGIGLDDFLDDALEGGGNEEKVVVVTEGVPVREEEGEPDPHVWHNPENAKIMVENIVATLVAADESNASAYRSAGDAYKRVLEETDAEIRRLVESIPTANRKFVSNHDSFGYFLDRYEIELVGTVIPGLSTQAEPSGKDIAELVETIKRENVKAIFAESSLDPKVANQIARDASVKIVDDLYGDSLGAPGSEAGTIHGMLLWNANRIAEALR